MNSKNLAYYFPDTKYTAGMKVFKEQGTSLTGFYFTKSNIALASKQDFSNNYAIYFLFDDVGDDNPSVYVGQSTNGVQRIKDHVRTKEFWNYCIMIVSDNDSFDKSTIDYLEYHFINLFKRTIYRLDNKEPRTSAPTIDRYSKSTYENYCDQIHFLLEANGIDFLDEIIKPKTETQYFEARKGIDAKLYIRDGFFMLTKDSIISLPLESSKDWKDQGSFYNLNTSRFISLIENGMAEKITDKTARLLDDVPFKSPSAPAELCSGYAENGWFFWKNLDSVRERK